MQTRPCELERILHTVALQFEMAWCCLLRLDSIALVYRQLNAELECESGSDCKVFSEYVFHPQRPNSGLAGRPSDHPSKPTVGLPGLRQKQGGTWAPARITRSSLPVGRDGLYFTPNLTPLDVRSPARLGARAGHIPCAPVLPTTSGRRGCLPPPLSPAYKVRNRCCESHGHAGRCREHRGP